MMSGRMTRARSSALTQAMSRRPRSPTRSRAWSTTRRTPCP